MQSVRLLGLPAASSGNERGTTVNAGSHRFPPKRGAGSALTGVGRSSCARDRHRMAKTGTLARWLGEHSEWSPPNSSIAHLDDVELSRNRRRNFCEAVLFDSLQQAGIEAAQIFQRIDPFAGISKKLYPNQTHDARLAPVLKYC